MRNKTKNIHQQLKANNSYNPKLKFNLYVCIPAVARDGECGADGVWPSLRSQEVQSLGHHLPKGPHSPLRRSHHSCLPLLVLGLAPPGDRAVGVDRGGRAAVRARPAAAARSLRALLPHAEVPAGAEHREPHGLHRRRGAAVSRPHLLVGRLRVPIRNPGGCPHLELLLVGARADHMALHHLQSCL